ncbi:MAG: bifunctional oligoribonuclease/PAP phosphatase NrnA [Bacteroidetes bacterium]|nr:bifunctional oligoribonuclease/PAP phosphatase NrnA [Bacteroidota bacterium]
MDKEKITSIKEILKNSSSIVIVAHTNPDGDAIGASLALKRFLANSGFNAQVVVPNKFHNFLDWMPGSDEILIGTNEFKKNETLIYDADLIFCLDFNSISRVDQLSNSLACSKAKKVLIDHHLSPEPFVDFLFSDIKSSSTSELVYDFIVEIGGANSIDEEIANCLFVGIMTDTGSFSFSCNNAKTFLVVAELIKAGLNVERVHKLIFDNNNESRLRLLGFCLSANMVVLHEFSTAYIHLSKEELEMHHFEAGDTENVVNYALSIKGINLAVLLMEKEEYVKISMRSKGDFSVNDLARNHFNGGGHRNAAGGMYDLPLANAIEHLESILPEYHDQIKNSLK